VNIFPANEVCVVTGGTRGIGRAITAILLENGCKVAATYIRNDQSADKFWKEISESTGRGSDLLIVKHDVQDRFDSSNLFEMAHNHFGYPVRLLVNNAGGMIRKEFMSINREQWNSTMSLNLESVFFICQEFFAYKKKIDLVSGSIVNISSIGGQTGGDKAPDYAISKGALIALTKSIAKLGCLEQIRCNCVAPGWIRTEIFSSENLAELETLAAEQIPMARIGEVREVASCVMFLLADSLSSYVTGQCLNVNGGMYLG
jgi:NAD(P)-dependent dehydrogenase (short-subunit alcohol dehydrogenase family)